MTTPLILPTAYQQLSLLNTHAQGYCFKPVHIYDAATGKPVCFVLRPGKRSSGKEAAMILRHVIACIRANWPRVCITVRGKYLYEKVYCARGKMENLIKEHKLYTRSDRTSCHRGQANQFRLLLHTGALLALAFVARRGATFETIRRAFLKISVRVQELKTCIRIALPTAYPPQGYAHLVAEPGHSAKTP